MSLPRIAILTATALAGLILAGPARADYLLTFGQAAYLGEPGSAVDVDLFLVEQGPGTVLRDDGLITAAFRLVINESPASPDPALVASIAANPGFDEVFTDIVQPGPGTAGEVVFFLDALLVPPVLAPESAPDRILLATVRFTLGSVLGSLTGLRLEVFDPTMDNFAVGPGFGTIIPNDAIAGGTSAVAVIPEPSSMLLSGAGLLAVSALVVRRGRAPGHA